MLLQPGGLRNACVQLVATLAARIFNTMLPKATCECLPKNIPVYVFYQCISSQRWQAVMDRMKGVAII